MFIRFDIGATGFFADSAERQPDLLLLLVHLDDLEVVLLARFQLDRMPSLVGGLRIVAEALDAIGSAPPSSAPGIVGGPSKIIAIVVNAHKNPTRDWDRSDSPPGKSDLMDQAWSIPVDRYSLEAVEAARDQLARWAGAAPGRTAHLVEVSFEGIVDLKERQYFYDVPTSFKLDDEQVDRLRQIAGRLLREVDEGQRHMRAAERANQTLRERLL